MTVDYFGTQGAHQIVNFSVTINRIALQLTENQANLGMDITLGLQDKGFATTGAFFINGIIEKNTIRQRWSYNGFRISKLYLNNVDINVAKVSGELEFMRDDPIYGKGFRALLSPTEINIYFSQRLYLS